MSVILRTASRTLFHTIVVFSLYLLFAGHNSPGGGFIGGLVAAGALVLRYIAEGPDDLRRVVPVNPPTLLGAGLLAAATAGVVGLLTGTDFLTSQYVEIPLGPIGTPKLTTVLLFDTGVYLIVVGMVHAILDTLGAEMNA